MWFRCSAQTLGCPSIRCVVLDVLLHCRFHGVSLVIYVVVDVLHRLVGIPLRYVVKDALHTFQGVPLTRCVINAILCSSLT